LRQMKSSDIPGAISTIQHINDSIGVSILLGRAMRHGSRSSNEEIVKALIDLIALRWSGEQGDLLLTGLFLEQSAALIRWGDSVAARASLDRAVSLIAAHKHDGQARIVARLYALLGEAVLAKSWFQAARVSADAKAREMKKPDPYGWLADEQIKAGYLADARATMNLITDLSPASPRWEVLEKIAAAEARAGDFDSAIATAKSIVKESTKYIEGGMCPRRDLARMAIVREQVREGDWTSADDIFVDMEPSWAKGRVFFGIAAALIASGDPEDVEAETFGEEYAELHRAGFYIHAVECLCFPPDVSEIEFFPPP
jgi:hypothetical protein